VGIWLPGYTRVDLGLHGKPFEYRQNPKGLLHSTEGTSLAGAEAAMRAYPSHLGYDCKTREKHQYISLDLAAYSAMDQSDDDPIYQVELVGFAEGMRHLPDWALRNIAEDVVKPLADAVGIPPNVIPFGFKDGLDGIYPYLASPESPIRLSYAGLRSFSGWLGHQHLPAPDDHWDPGAINIRRILEIAYGGEEADMVMLAKDGDKVYWIAATERGLVKEHVATIDLANYLVSQGAKVTPLDVNILRGITPAGQPAPVALSPADRDAIVTAVSAALSSNLAQAVVAEFKKEGN
jgi:hypothetical protein